MPIASPRPCGQPGCRSMQVERGRCSVHQLPSTWEQSHRGKTAEQRGYGHAWKLKRKQILLRDQGICQPCIKSVPSRVSMATQVDHIVPKAHGGTDDDDNLQAICTACHAAKTAREGVRRKSGGFRLNTVAPVNFL